MNKESKYWTKEELKIYMLLLCAKADYIESPEEIAMIKSKINNATFERLYSEFCCDKEENCLDKIQAAIAHHEYSVKELKNIRKEIHEVFISDHKFNLKERQLNRLLDSMLY